MASSLTLFGYWRSSAAYRVRIALNLKALEYRQVAVHLVNDGGEHHKPEFRALNPQELVPVLQHGQHVIRQSLAIIEYLEESFTTGLALLPQGRAARAHVRALAQAVACDIHPLNNLRVMQYLDGQLGVPQAGRDAWVQHWMTKGLGAMEALLRDSADTDHFCHGQTPGLADACLIPQLYNARRFRIDLAPFPTLARIDERCMAMPEFASAAPEMQEDAVR